MLKSKHINIICLFFILLGMGLTLLFMSGESWGLLPLQSVPGYQLRLFDSSRVHSIDLQIEDWEGFLENAEAEEYQSCTAVIDGEEFATVGIRCKGNNSLRLVKKYQLSRYSMKLEFDHYEKDNSYYGLDKFSLDSAFQDNSYLKNYLAYDMMDFMGVPTPLCSYVWVTVNSRPWGLFLAVEEPEEGFARRCFGYGHGQLYKPDYRSLEAENADVALKYLGDEPEKYDNIFRKAKFDIDEEDQRRLIKALKILSEGENLEEAIDVDEVLRYFTVQVFVVNMDSYLGRTGHNYFLYEEDGRLSILPWDYNLAFTTYSLGMPNPINDAGLYVNYPIDTPASGEIMKNRPLYHNLMKNNNYFSKYHEYFDTFIKGYFESGYFQQRAAKAALMIAPYVEKDPTAFCSFQDHRLAVDTLTRFCLLRAESVREQLNGSIPSTIKGQAADSSNFIDASSIRLPDMGEIADLKD